MGCNVEHVEEVLASLRSDNEEVERREQEISDFLTTLKSYMQDCGCDVLEGATYEYSGSAFEGTAVSEDADFDIPLVLPEPYVADNFQVHDRHEPGICKLRWDSDESPRPDFINKNGFLEANKLRQYVLQELSTVLKDVRNDNRHWKLSCKKLLNSMMVIITDSEGDRLKMDIVVQMGEPEWGQLEDMVEEDELPASLQWHLQEVQYPMFYNLASHSTLSHHNDHHLLVSTSFSLLEKYCMQESDGVREAVMLAKLVSQDRGWKKQYGLRAFHIKRVAIKHYDELDSVDAWSGYQRLMKYLAEQLRNEEIEGFFINDQNIFWKDGSQCNSLAGDIMKAKSAVQPNNIWNLLPASDSETDSQSDSD